MYIGHCFHHCCGSEHSKYVDRECEYSSQSEDNFFEVDIHKPCHEIYALGDRLIRMFLPLSKLPFCLYKQLLAAFSMQSPTKRGAAREQRNNLWILCLAVILSLFKAATGSAVFFCCFAFFEEKYQPWQTQLPLQTELYLPQVHLSCRKRCWQYVNKSWDFLFARWGFCLPQV